MRQTVPRLPQSYGGAVKVGLPRQGRTGSGEDDDLRQDAIDAKLCLRRRLQPCPPGNLPSFRHLHTYRPLEGGMKGRPERECRCYICWQKMVMWHWSEKLKTYVEESWNVMSKTCCIAEYWKRRRMIQTYSTFTEVCFTIPLIVKMSIHIECNTIIQYNKCQRWIISPYVFMIFTGFELLICHCQHYG